jgi:5-methylthioadenosine/S-adenosylhomocysteine deaminase
MLDGEDASVDECLALPGFVNAHTHLPMVLLRGVAEDIPLDPWLNHHVWPAERRLQPDDVYWGALLAIAEGIHSGVTAFADMYFHSDAIAQAVEESGVRALLSYGMVAPSLADGGADELERARRFVSAWHGRANGRIHAAVAPHAVHTCGEDVWREAIALANAYSVPIHTHVAETRAEVESWRAKTGFSPVEWLHRLGALTVPILLAHCVHVDARDIALLAADSVTVVHCPKSNAKLGSGIAPIPAMRASGVRISLGTDGAASNNRQDMLEEQRAAWLLQRALHEDATALTSRDLLNMSVANGRKALELTGSGLTEGDPADAVILRTQSPHVAARSQAEGWLAFEAVACDVTDVYVNGQALLQCGELQTIDEERVRYEVHRRIRRITRT